MNSQSTFMFRWLSPLGIAATIFLIHGLMVIAAALAAFWLYRRPGGTKCYAGRGGLILSGRADSAFLGRPVSEVIQENKILTTVQDLVMKIWAGWWLSFGIFEVALVWFGVRQGLAWAFWTVVFSNLVVLAGFASVAREFIRHGVRLGFDLPPVALYAMIGTPIGALLGWMGLR